MHGKKCPPLKPKAIELLVKKSLNIPINSKNITPISLYFSANISISFSPENIVSGSSVPTIPMINPPITHLINTLLLNNFDIIFIYLCIKR